MAGGVGVAAEGGGCGVRVWGMGGWCCEVRAGAGGGGWVGGLWGVGYGFEGGGEVEGGGVAVGRVLGEAVLEGGVEFGGDAGEGGGGLFDDAADEVVGAGVGFGSEGGVAGGEGVEGGGEGVDVAEGFGSEMKYPNWTRRSWMRVTLAPELPRPWTIPSSATMTVPLAAYPPETVLGPDAGAQPTSIEPTKATVRAMRTENERLRPAERVGGRNCFISISLSDG